MESAKPYPGDATTAEEMLRLAQEFDHAARCLLNAIDRPGNQLSDAPCRLAAIHAIELYLNALLLSAGHEMSRLRRMQHDLGARASLAHDAGLVWRQRTEAHLSAMTADREYLLARYEPGALAATSQINRLTATLTETAKKVRSILAKPRSPQTPVGSKNRVLSPPTVSSEKFCTTPVASRQAR